MSAVSFESEPTARVLADEHVFLNGRPPLPEFLGFLTAQTLEGEAVDPAALTATWREANDHIRELEKSEAGWPDKPAVGEIPDALDSFRQQVLADAVVRRTFGVVPCEIAMVELDRLVVFQKHVNLEYVRQLQRLLGADPSDGDIFRFALPFERRSDPQVHHARIAQNAWAFVSPSTDFRILDTIILEPDRATGLEISGVPVAVVALVVGYGANYLSAISAQDRLILHNGSHRAYALREVGVTHAPCLIQRVSRNEEFELIANDELKQHADLYLRAPRPPVLKDYFDKRLRLLVHVPRTLRQVRAILNYETSDVPAAG